MAYADPQKQRAYIKRWRAENPEKVKAWDARSKHKRRAAIAARRQDPTHRAAEAARVASYLAALKEALFDHYGRICVCCGESRREFLTFDHPHNDGAQRRREHKGTQQEWRAVRRNGFSPGYYEVRCFNCNSARYLYGICPHERDRVRQKDAA